MSPKLTKPKAKVSLMGELTPCPKGIGVNTLCSWHRVTLVGNPKGRSPVAVRRVNALRYGVALQRSFILPASGHQ